MGDSFFLYPHDYPVIMVFFVIGGHYHKDNTRIIITGIGKDHVTYMRANGRTEYRANLHWAKMKHSQHVLQYIRLDGKRIYSVNVGD